MFKITAFLIAVLASAQAQAWGSREQGALAGIAGTLLIQHVLKERQPVQPQSYPPVYTGQPPVSAPQPQPQSQTAPVIIINDGYRGRACHIVQVWDPTGRFYYGDRQVCSLL